MRQIIYMPLEALFERACQLRNFEQKPDEPFYERQDSERMVNSWVNWYELNVEVTRMKSGEVEQAVWEALDIPNPARNGFIVQRVLDDAVLITDLEEACVCDLHDAEDHYLRLPVEQFREWLYRWNADPLNRVMDTAEAAAVWGYSSADAVKRLCREGTIQSRKLSNGSYIVARNQPSPKAK